MEKLSKKIIFLLSVMAGPGLMWGCDTDSKDYREYDTWDADGNYVIDDREFNSSYPESGLFKTWDMDSSNGVDPEEFFTSSYQMWDEDQDGILDANEWSAATTFYFSTRQFEKRGEFDEWDTNNNNKLERNEFAIYARGVAYFEDWDTNSDNRLDEEEFSQLIFRFYDLDRDGVIRENEFSALNSMTDSEE